MDTRQPQQKKPEYYIAYLLSGLDPSITYRVKLIRQNGETELSPESEINVMLGERFLADAHIHSNQVYVDDFYKAISFINRENQKII